MRRAPTFAEQKLWKELRATDLHFRRQAPLGPYIVDFVCHEHRIVVELDGGVHALPEVVLRDEARELWLTGRGYTVMRFLNEQAVSDTLSVVQMILARVSAGTPTPIPSPQGGGGF